jgi:hypothetical protein
MARSRRSIAAEIVDRLSGVTAVRLKPVTTCVI